jgi:hypothetical protein
MAYRPEADDPLSGGEKIPSLSWKDLPIGSLFTCEVLEPAKSLQSRDFSTNELAYWDAEKTRPILSAVINVRVLSGPHSVGEDRSIWAQIPSNLFVALKEAQKAAECRIAPGGTLHLKFTGEVPHENPRFNKIKQYAAKYIPGTASTAPDPFAGQAAPAAQAPRPVTPPRSPYATPATTTTAPGTKPKGW